MDRYRKYTICAINGSSRINGKTAKRLDLILKGIRKLGARGEMIHLVQEKLQPCDGTQNPKLRNDIKPMLKKIEMADGIIFGTPTYWFNMSGLMKNFIDRLTITERTWSLEWKVAGFIASGAEKEDGTMAAITSMAAAANHLGMVIFPYSMLYFHGAGAAWAKTDLRKYAKWMLEMISMVHKFKGN